MKNYIKNCTVQIIGGEVIHPTNEKKDRADDSLTCSARPGILYTYTTYSIRGFLENRANVEEGDRVLLPRFGVPPVSVSGEKKLEFKDLWLINEYVVVVATNKTEILLKFERALFDSAVDLNGETEFSKTQLGSYLDTVFMDAMNSAGIPAKTVRLLTRDEIFDDDRLAFFRNAKNRISFDGNENLGFCWLGTNIDNRFYGVGSHGEECSNVATNISAVSPVFIIKKEHTA